MSETTTTSGPWAFLTENFRLLALGGLGWVALRTQQGKPVVPASEIPQTWELGASAAVLGGFAILFATGALGDLFPEDRGVFLQVVNARRTDAIETWELTEDQWADITVVGDQLNHLPACKHRTYECIAYDDEENVAVGTWRRSKPASQIVGHHSVEDALDEMEEIRSDLEPEARFSSILRRRLPSIVRTLDRQRAMDQNRTLEPHMTPAFEDGKSVDDVLRETLDDDFLPPRLQNNEDDEGEVARDRSAMGDAVAGLDLLAELGEGVEADRPAPLPDGGEDGE
jgi:hypothetical protein